MSPTATHGEHPLRLGASLSRGSEASSSRLLLLKYDFQPASVARATSGLLLQSEGTGQAILYPQQGPGEQPAYYDGVVETKLDPAAVAADKDVECVAVFDGTQWTLELLSATIRSKCVCGVCVCVARRRASPRVAASRPLHPDTRERSPQKHTHNNNTGTSAASPTSRAWRRSRR